MSPITLIEGLAYLHPHQPEIVADHPAMRGVWTTCRHLLGQHQNSFLAPLLVDDISRVGSQAPIQTVEQIVGEPLMVHNLATGKEIHERVEHLLEVVGLNPSFATRYPHEFSGGQRQRIGVARALSLQPSFIICDEPISALDVSIQAQVVNLLEELQQQFNLTYLFIAHDLSMVRHTSRRVAVMYLGVIVELAGRDDLYKNPLHPYTQALLSAVPIADPIIAEQRKRTILEGDVPSPANPPSGCRFRTRCPIAEKACAESQPDFREMSPGHFVACHLVK